VATTARAKQIDAATSAKDALCLLMTLGATEFARHLRGVMTSDDPEGPHKARVALRRLRVALMAFKPIIAKPLFSRLQTAMRDTFRTLGTLRDADVLAQATNLPDLHAAASATRTQVRADLKAVRASRLGGQITRTFAAKSWRRQGTKSLRAAPAARFAATALHKSWHKCLKFGPDLTILPIETRHELRKSLKTLRYLCDHFTNLWTGPAHDALVARLKVLQEDLGTLNDHASARTLGFDAPDDAPFLATAQTHWSALRDAAPYWPTPNQP
jgi:CHAD domain-containing protein